MKMYLKIEDNTIKDVKFKTFGCGDVYKRQVERALAIFQQLGLVEQLDCGLLYMTDIEPVSYTHLDVYKRQLPEQM